MNSPGDKIDEAEILIVGAGPAGSSAAATAAELGHDVLLIDQDDFPRDKPCGDGLTRSGVSFLQNLGLEDFIEGSHPVEGARLVINYAFDLHRWYQPRPDRPRYARCVSRHSMDNALLGAAQERGARFRRARAEAPIFSDSSANGVAVRSGEERGWIGARYVIAADGATSRLRRECSIGKPQYLMGLYGVRQYALTERELDPVFDVYGPLSFEGAALVGYGWVFPLGPHLANVGIGFFKDAGLGATPPIRPVLASFIDDLNTKCAHRFGELQLQGKPFGSPVGVNFDAERCQVENVLFTGDAARTTDPLSGEGIAYALHAGEAVAQMAHQALNGGAGRRPQVGLTLARRFPRLGQDVAMPARIGLRAMNGAALDLTETERQPFLHSIKRLIASSEDDPSLRATPSWDFASRLDPRLADCLESWNDQALDALRTAFPFTSELLHRELRGYGGPTRALTLFVVNQACGGKVDEAAMSGALALELLRLAHVGFAQVTAESSSDLGKMNNVLAGVVGDFCLSRALPACAPAGIAATRAVARTSQRYCQGQMLEVRDLFDLDRSTERYYEAIEGKNAALFETCAALGAELAGAGEQAVAGLASYGHQLGVAFQLADDLIEFVAGDEVTGKRPGNDLRHGFYKLPLIYALQAEAGLAKDIGPSLESEELEAVVECVKRVGGVDRALEDCQRHSDAAQAQAEALSIPGAEMLAQLAAFSASRAASAVAASAVIKEIAEVA
jgi:geranylgeranyl reductase family protein